jgi:hypothetical protein
MLDRLASVPQILRTIVIGVGLGVMVMLPGVTLLWWVHHGDQRHREVQAQVRAMEQQIREEAMSEEARDWHRQWRQRQADIAREARRRLGLPEEDDR